MPIRFLRVALVLGLGVFQAACISASTGTNQLSALVDQDHQRASACALNVVLDSGHTPAQGGATSIHGTKEVAYNDHFTRLLANAFEAQGHRISLTRKPDEDISLTQRSDYANATGADLFLSIHHDSAQVQFLEKINVEGRSAWRSKFPIRGFSVFVSQINPRFEDSRTLAKSIAQALVASGRNPSLHHAEKIAGESRELLDADLGLYRFDELLVLRKTQIPALLLEVGVIVDAEDEALITDLEQQKAMVAAVVSAVSSSCRHQ